MTAGTDQTTAAAADHVRLWVLLAADPASGAATRPVGVLGVAGEAWHVSWLPLEPAAVVWQERLAVPSSVPMPERVAFWTEYANGVTVDLAPFDTDPASDGLCDAVERAVDVLLAVPSAGA